MLALVSFSGVVEKIQEGRERREEVGEMQKKKGSPGDLQLSHFRLCILDVLHEFLEIL